MVREEHKIIIEKEIWERLRHICEVEGIPLSYKLEQLVMDKYAWNIEVKQVEQKRDTNRIKQLLIEAIKLNKIPDNELHEFEVLFCNKCVRINIVNRYSIAPWLCDICEEKLERLGTLNNMVGR